MYELYEASFSHEYWQKDIKLSDNRIENDLFDSLGGGFSHFSIFDLK